MGENLSNKIIVTLVTQVLRSYLCCVSVTEQKLSQEVDFFVLSSHSSSLKQKNKLKSDVTCIKDLEDINQSLNITLWQSVLALHCASFKYYTLL